MANRKIIRIKGNSDLQASAATNQALFSGNTVEFQVGLFDGSDSVVDVSNLVTTLEIKDLGLRRLPDPNGTVRMTQTLSAGNTLTAEEWENKTNQHYSFIFEKESTGLTAGEYWLTIAALDNESPSESVTFVAGIFTINEDGYLGSAGNPPNIEIGYYNTNQIDGLVDSLTDKSRQLASVSIDTIPALNRYSGVILDGLTSELRVADSVWLQPPSDQFSLILPGFTSFDTVAQQVIMTRRRSAGQAEFSVNLNTDGSISLILFDSGGTANRTSFDSSANLIESNRFYSIIIAFDGNGVVFYINGKAYPSTPDIVGNGFTNTFTDSAAFLQFGARYTDSPSDLFFNGMFFGISAILNFCINSTEAALLFRNHNLLKQSKWSSVDYQNALSGSLTVGQEYRIVSNTGLNVTNVGASSNLVGTRFVATGSSPTSWGSGALKAIGCMWAGDFEKGESGIFEDFINNAIVPIPMIAQGSGWIQAHKERSEFSISIEVNNTSGSPLDTNLNGGEIQPPSTVLLGVASRRISGTGGYRISSSPGGGGGILTVGATSGVYSDESSLGNQQYTTSANDIYAEVDANTRFVFTFYFRRFK